MGVVKFIRGKNVNFAQLNGIIKYITNPKKTSEQYIKGIGVASEKAYQHMCTMKKLLRKVDGRQYIHFIYSPDPKDNVTPETVDKINADIASYFSEDYQMIYAIHTNTKNIHSHYIINTVNVNTGRKWSQSKSDLQELKDYTNSVLTKYGLSLIGRSYEVTLDDLDEWGEAIDKLIEDIDDERDDKELVKPVSFQKEDSEEKSTNYLEDDLDIEESDSSKGNFDSKDNSTLTSIWQEPNENVCGLHWCNTHRSHRPNHRISSITNENENSNAENLVKPVSFGLIQPVSFAPVSFVPVSFGLIKAVSFVEKKN